VKKNMRNVFLAVGAMILISITSAAARADQMEYFQTMTGSGNLSGTPFSNATITFEVDADTNNITHPYPTDNHLNGTGTVTISGLGTYADLDAGYHVFVNSAGADGPTAGMSATGDYYDMVAPAFSTYDLIGDIGPVAATSVSSMAFAIPAISTSGGTLDISSAGANEAFSAVLVPEPAAVGILGLTALASRRSARRRDRVF
jgi:hypothetical protein